MHSCFAYPGRWKLWKPPTKLIYYKNTHGTQKVTINWSTLFTPWRRFRYVYWSFAWNTWFVMKVSPSCRSPSTLTRKSQFFHKAARHETRSLSTYTPDRDTKAMSFALESTFLHGADSFLLNEVKTCPTSSHMWPLTYGLSLTRGRTFLFRGGQSSSPSF